MLSYVVLVILNLIWFLFYYYFFRLNIRIYNKKDSISKTRLYFEIIFSIFLVFLIIIFPIWFAYNFYFNFIVFLIFITLNYLIIIKKNNKKIIYLIFFITLLPYILAINWIKCNNYPNNINSIKNDWFTCECVWLKFKNSLRWSKCFWKTIIIYN